WRGPRALRRSRSLSGQEDRQEPRRAVLERRLGAQAVSDRRSRGRRDRAGAARPAPGRGRQPAMTTADRRAAERRVGWARFWARAVQIVTTDPTGSDEDDHVADEHAAKVLARSAGRLKGGLAKVAQLAAYDPGATLGSGRGATPHARAVLGDLWDRAPALSGAAIADVVAADLGRPPQALFAAWDPVPLAAASLGQVHAARLDDGPDVVVKVQYPGVAEALRADLDDATFVRKLAGSEIGRSLDGGALRALGAAVRGELDYRAEAHALERFAAAWRGHPVLRFPRVIG